MAMRIKHHRPLSHARLVVGLVAVICLTGWHSSLTAQSERVDQAEWKRGYNGFALLCRSLNLQIENDLRTWQAIPPRQSMVIVFGSTERLPFDLVDYVDRGGAALVANDQRDYRSFLTWGIVFNRGPQRAARDKDMFRSRDDCPLITDLDRSHPVVEDCESLVTNRPGFLGYSPDAGVAQRYRRATIARLPTLISRRSRINDWPILASLEPNDDARVLLVADQSIFSNQMLTCGDNAKFALRAIQWLGEGNRDTVLIVSAREVIDPTNPDQLHIMLPPPDPAEVIAALDQLPPEALIAFGDSVVAAVEDEGVFNELITYVVGEIPRNLYARVLILIATTVVLAFLILRLFNRRDESEVKWGSSRSSRGRSRLERKQAAKLLLAQFRANVTGDATTPLSRLVGAVRIPSDQRRTKTLRREISTATRRVQAQSLKYWTKRRLRRLQQRVAGWRQLHEQRLLEYHSSLESQ